MSDFGDVSNEQLQLLLDQIPPDSQTPTPVVNKGALGHLPVPLPGGSDDPTAGMTDAQRTLAGLGRGMTNVFRQIGNVAGLKSDASLAEANKYDQPLLNTSAGNFGNLLGEASVLAPATAAGEMALGASPLAGLLAHPVALGALEGAGQGALMAGPGSRGAGAIAGGLTGAAVPAIGSALDTAIRGLSRTPEAQLLLDKGIPLTPGQMNPKGNANLIEQSADRLPVVGPMIDSARENAEQEFGRAVIQQGAAPGAKITPSHNINEMFDEAKSSWDPVYAQVHGYPIKPAVGNQPLSAALQAASQVPGLSKSQQFSINSWLQNRLGALPTNPKSEDYIGKDSLRSAIRGQVRNLTRSVNAGQIDAPLMRQAYENAEDAVTRTLESQLPPQAVATLRGADMGYAQLKVIENAVAAAKDQASGLTPSKLSSAIYASSDKSQYARGAGGPLRDLASAGTKVFETTVPPTGVRTPLAMAAAGLGYAYPHVALPLMGAGAAGGLMAAATPFGRRLSAGQTVGQQALQSLMNSVPGQTIVPWGGLAARQITNRALAPRATALSNEQQDRLRGLLSGP